MVMTLKNHRLRSSLKLLFFGLEFCVLFLSFLFLISFPMLLGQLTPGCPHALVPSQFPYRCSANMEELYDLVVRIWTIRPSIFHLRNYSRSRQRQLAFQVLDENDNSPIFVQTQPNVTVPEDAKVLLPIYRYFLLQKKFYSKYISPS